MLFRTGSRGNRALQRWANVEAISHLKKGLELLRSIPDSAERNRADNETMRYSLLYKLGEARQAAGEFSEACDAFLRASEVARYGWDQPTIRKLCSGVRANGALWRHDHA